jgi:hypothetical protein
VPTLGSTVPCTRVAVLGKEKCPEQAQTLQIVCTGERCPLLKYQSKHLRDRSIGSKPYKNGVF